MSAPRTRTASRVALLLPVAVILTVIAWGALRHQDTTAIGAALARGEAPPVPATMLPGFDGRSVSLTAFRGHPMVVNFWASWCAPCIEEAPALEELWNGFRGKGLIVVGVDTQDLAAPARRFVETHRISYVNVRDPDGSLARLFGTTGVPETFFVDRDGHVRGKFPGVEVQRSIWRAAAESLLAGRPRVP